jgi:hypothetical protein
MAAITNRTYMLGISISNSTGQVKSNNSGIRMKAPVKLRSMILPLICCPRGKMTTGMNTFVRGYWRVLFLIGFFVQPGEPRDLSDSGWLFIPTAPMEGSNNMKRRPCDLAELGCWWRRQEWSLRPQRCQRPAPWYFSFLKE